MNVARDHRQVMMQGRGSQETINDRQRRAVSLCIADEFSPVIGNGHIDAEQSA